MRRLITIGSLALTLGAASLAAAGPAPSGPGPSGPPPLPPPECVPPGVTPGMPPPPGFQPPPDWHPPAQCSQYGPPPGPGGPGPGGLGPGGAGPDFAPAFFSRNWRILGQVLLTDTLKGKQVIDFNVDKLLNPPKLLRDEGREVADQGALVIVSPKVVITEKGRRITFAQIQADDHLTVTGKFLREDKWVEDEDGDPAPTVRAKRIQVVS